jgi:hypothetical protein
MLVISIKLPVETNSLVLPIKNLLNCEMDKL